MRIMRPRQRQERVDIEVSMGPRRAAVNPRSAGRRHEPPDRAIRDEVAAKKLTRTEHGLDAHLAALGRSAS